MLARELKAKPNLVIALNNLSVMALAQGDLLRAWALRREMGNKLGIANSVGNLGK